MKNYDPTKPPDPEKWQALDHDEQVEMIRRFHQRARLKPPNAEAHAMFHAVVEGQIAGGDARVRETLERLMREGLDRHDALHAVASVLAEQMWNAMNKPQEGGSLPDAYYQGLEALSASTWLGSE